MKAVKGKNNRISFVSRDEAKIINMAEVDGFIPQTSLCERDAYIAEELFKKDLIRKVNQNGSMGYKAYSNML